MTLFNFPWIRKFFRRHMRPMDVQHAGRWKSRLSVAYALLAWNAFGIVCYCIATGKADWAKYHGLVSEEEAALKPAQHYARKLGIKNASVWRISGTDVSSYTIEEEDKSEQSEAKKE